MKIKYMIIIFLMLQQAVFAHICDDVVKIKEEKNYQTIDDFGKYHALLIYVENYTHTEIWPILHTPKSDVCSLREILYRRYNFPLENIHIVADPKNSDELIREFDKLATTLGEHDNLLIYYGGHGSIKKNTKKGYWNLADAIDIERGRDGSISLESAVLESLLAIKSKHVLVVSDSCYSGVLSRGKNDSTLVDNVSRNDILYYRGVYEQTSRTVLTAGGLTPVKDYDIIDKKHSIFAKSLLNALERNREPIFGLNEKYKEIRAYVSNNTDKQVPEYEGIRDSGQEIGADFIFIDKKNIGDSGEITVTHDSSTKVQALSPVSSINNSTNSKIDKYLMYALGVVSLLLIIVSIVHFRTRKKIPEGNTGKKIKGETLPPVRKKIPPKKNKKEIEGVMVMGNLIYQNQPFTKEYSWEEAKEYAKNLRLGGFDDWRLPTRQELRALGSVELHKENDAFWQEWYENHKDDAVTNSKDERHFVHQKLVDNMPKESIFWTSEAKDEEEIWQVAFHLGVNDVAYREDRAYVLCVRENKEGDK